VHRLPQTPGSFFIGDLPEGKRFSIEFAHGFHLTGKRTRAPFSLRAPHSTQTQRHAQLNRNRYGAPICLGISEYFLSSHTMG
jgi:hypothetical protein